LVALSFLAVSLVAIRYGTGESEQEAVPFGKDEIAFYQCDHLGTCEPYSVRFVSSDPIELRGGLTLHQYAPNPSLWIDPLGLAGGPAVGVDAGGKWVDASGRAASVPHVARLPTLHGSTMGQTLGNNATFTSD
jgi:uncharacterized protein RhaS with RHS repeats